MRKLVECVPNFSEGRRREVIEAIAQAIRATKGVRLLDVESDPDHNRSVMTFIGEPEPVRRAAFSAAAKAVELIDMEKHRGEHPRLGAGAAELRCELLQRPGGAAVETEPAEHDRALACRQHRERARIG
ncbi:MAG: hypothetical protein QXW06_00650, partial [Thermoplasmata archaeon]